MNIVQRAEAIAREAHQGQFRKWSIDQFIVHPERVANKVASLPSITHEDTAAAWLHDVLEDVAIPRGIYKSYADLILTDCGPQVLDIVMDLTAPSSWPEWEGQPRALKRAVDWPHLDKASDRSKRIKLVDRWDNLGDMRNAPAKLLAKTVAESYDIHRICHTADEYMAAELMHRIHSLERTVS